MNSDTLICEQVIDIFQDLDQAFKTTLKESFNSKLPLYVLRKDFLQPQLKQKYFQILQRDGFMMLVKIATQVIYYFKHDQGNIQLKIVEDQLKEQYFALFADLPQPKDELINFTLMMAGFFVHRCMYEMIPSIKRSIDSRYVYDIYHILLYKCNGLLVSDHYVKSQIDAYFNNKYLDYQLSELELHVIKKKPVVKKHQIEQSFLGQKLKFPELSSSPENDQFKSKLLEKLRQKKRTDSFRHIHFQKTLEKEADPEIELERVRYLSDHVPKKIIESTHQFNHISLNLNQLSPSVSHVLDLQENQLQETRPIKVSHRLQQDNQKDAQVNQMLKMIKDSKKEKFHSQSSMYSDRKSKFKDNFNCPQPPQGYFDKHPKLNHLFKNMLQLNYVLKFNQQSYNDVQSSSIKRSTQEDQRPQPTVFSPKVRMMEMLREKEENLLQMKMNEQKLQEQSQEELSRQEQSRQQEMFLSQRRKSGVFVASPQKSNNQDNLSVGRQADESQLYYSQLTTRRSTVVGNRLKAIPENNRQSQSMSNLPSLPVQKWTSAYIYEDKRKAYTKDFENLIENISTDSKINQIVHNLQVKQNNFSKALGRKNHKK